MKSYTCFWRRVRAIVVRGLRQYCQRRKGEKSRTMYRFRYPATFLAAQRRVPGITARVRIRPTVPTLSPKAARRVGHPEPDGNMIVKRKDGSPRGGGVH